MANKPWPSHYKVEAEISECGLYRYSLEIGWRFPIRKMMGLVMLNPSDASHLVSDPTAIRGIGFAQREGFDAISIGNPYAFRSKDPADLLKAMDPIGPRNEEALKRLLGKCEVVVVGWGTKLGYNPTRQKFLLLVDSLEKDLWCLGKTKNLEPRHPLYLRASSPLLMWRRYTEIEMFKPAPAAGS